MYKSKNSSKKIALIVGLSTSIILCILFILNASRQKKDIIEENKKKARLLTTQLTITLLAESKSDSTHIMPQILSQRINNITLTRGIYSFKFLSPSVLKTSNDLTLFENDALLRLEEGDEEAYLIEENTSQYIAPIYAELSCLRCHKNKRTGNLLGAISVSMPIQNLNKWMKSNIIKISLLALIIFLIFYFLIKLLWKIFTIEVPIVDSAEKDFYDKKLKEMANNHSLEIQKLNQKIAEQMSKEQEIYTKSNTEIEKQKKDFLKTQLGFKDTAQKLRDIENEMSFHKDLLKTITFNINEGIYVVDNEDKIIFWSLQIEDITGLKREEMMGKILNEDIFSYENNKGYISRENYPTIQALKKGTIINLTDINLKKYKGDKISANIKTLPIIDNQNRILGVLGIIAEKPKEIIKEEKRLQEPVIKYDDNLKSILKSIEDRIEIIRDGDTGDINSTQMEFIDEIYNAIKELKKIIKEN